MAGGFNKQNRPKRLGSYTNWTAQQSVTVLPRTGATVALPVTHDWGPFKRATLVQSMAEFDLIFGNSDTGGRRAVLQAFKGEGIAGYGGAGAVIVYRWGGSAAAKAVKALTNTTPATALTLTAIYEGTKGNSLKIAVQDNAADASKDDLIVYLGTVEVERFTYTQTDIAGLAATINATSDWMTAVSNVTGTALTAIAPPGTGFVATAGADGDAAITGTDVTAMQGALGTERFRVFAFQDIQGTAWSGTTASAQVSSLLTWAVGLNKVGKRFMSVIGGAAGETVSTANTRTAVLSAVPAGESQSFGEDFINLGVGTYEDDTLNAAGTAVTLSTSQLAPRVAGILASRGEAKSANYARFQGLSIVTGPTDADVLTAFDAGTTVLTRDSNVDAPVHLDTALTAYVSQSDSQKPYIIYRNPKYVLTMMGLEMDLDEWATGPSGPIYNSMPVNDNTRNAVAGRLAVLLDDRVRGGVIQPNPTIEVDGDPPPSDDDEFIAFKYGIAFERTVGQVYNTIQVG